MGQASALLQKLAPPGLFSFVSPKENQKSDRVSTRGPSTRAAALDPLLEDCTGAKTAKKIIGLSGFLRSRFFLNAVLPPALIWEIVRGRRGRNIMTAGLRQRKSLSGAARQLPPMGERLPKR